MKTILLSAVLLTYGFLGAQIKSTEKQIIIEGKDTITIIKDVLEGDLKRQTILQTADNSFMTIEDQADGSQKQTIIKGGDTTIIITKNSGENVLIEELEDIKIDEESDSTKINLGKMKIVIIEDKGNEKKGQKKIIIDEKVIIDNNGNILNEDKDDKPEENDYAHWAGFGIMANGFLNSSGKISTAADAEFLELDYARSIGVNFNLLEKRFPVFKEYIGLTTGLGIQWNRYMLKNNVDVFSNQDTTFGVANGFIDYRKNVLRTTYLQAPLLLEFNTNKNPEKAWHLSVGVVGGIRIGSSLKTKWEEDDKTRKERVKSNFNFNPFQAYATAIIGYHNANLYVNYGLTEIFEKGKGPAFSSVNAGILFTFHDSRGKRGYHFL
ncbi:MAG: PorT family protein [Bacteroidetes bacterium]|nr:PorT family protein [Bacteroidota bacterium]